MNSNVLTNEQQMVASQFAQSFGGGWERPLVLYGLGRNTEAILQICPYPEIAGVMGPDANGPVWRGKPVLSGKEAASLGADIVIVARDSVVPLIYRRIAGLESQNVRIFRIDGTRLVDSMRQWNGGSLPYWKLTKEELKRRIECASCVSFDIFDTMLGRRLLQPGDLYEALERQLLNRSRKWEGFQKVRWESENALGVNAGIEAIYRRIQQVLKLDESTAMQLMELEWKLEQETVYLRQDMAEIFRYAEERSKHIVLISDMFWPAERLRRLLDAKGLQTAAPILVSCEEGCSKEDGGLYAAYLEHTGANPPGGGLHIGDNRYADVEAAQRAGLSACQILSGFQMLEASAAQSLLDCTVAWEDNCAVGKWVSERCSSPFALHKGGGRISVETPYELGHDFLAPLVDFWLGWLHEKLRGSRVNKMLFPARDGYLIQKLYERLREGAPGLPPSVYFKASRRAVSVASLRTAEDVCEVAARGFHGSTRSFFHSRFGIDAGDETLWEPENRSSQEMLKRATPAILKHAGEERACYLDYLNQLGLPGDGVSGFFDFVAGGTVQRFYERLTGSKTAGFYFATSNLPNRFYKPEEIAAPFGNITSYGCSNPLAEHYIIMENVLTDPDTMLVRVGQDGKMIYADGQNAAWHVMKQIQQGIFDHVSERLNRKEPPAGKNAALSIFGLLFDGSVIVPQSLRKWFVYEDTYDNLKPELCWT